MTGSRSDFFKLHFVVLLFGFTGVLGKLVSISAVEMVFYRTALAAMGMAVLLLVVRGNFAITTSDLVKILLTGFIVSAHWLTFFASARVSNVSVSLVGFATASLWTALIEPMVKGYKIRMVEVIFGSMVLVGLYIIFSSGFTYSAGLILGILSGLTCALFSVINSQIVQRVTPFTITFYEMIGATVATALFFPFYRELWAEGNQLQLSPAPMDWIWIGLLAWLCTVYAYSVAVELMKRVSVFFFQLTLNLEPVYGIVMAVLVFGDEEKMNVNFYAGTVIILLAVACFPWMRRKLSSASA